ncbi:MAG: RNA polymerase sigma factor [Planctomycetota bacterium]
MSDERDIEQHLPQLEKYVRHHMGSKLAARESSQDIVQSVCRELITAGSKLSFPNDRALHAWLQTAAKNKILQKARHHRSQRRASDLEVAAADTRIQSQLGDQLTPSRDASAREQVERIETAMAGLSDEDREIITLIRVTGLSHAEAAAQTGRSVEASRAHLRRALVHLSRLLTTPTDPTP